MKRPQPDIGVLLLQDFIGNLATIRKFKRLWGTTTVDGIEVFNLRQYYLPANARSATFEKLFRYLGAYEDTVDADYHGIKEAWLFLNKNKDSTLKPSQYSNGIPEFVTDNLNLMWWDPADGTMPSGLTLTTDIVIETDEFLAANNPGLATVDSIIAQNLPKAQLITAVGTSFDDLWLTSRVTQQGVGVINKGSITDPVTAVVTPDEDDLTQDDPWMATAARYTLRSSGVPHTIKNVSLGLGTYRDNNPSYISNTLVITIEIPYILFTQASPIVLAISSDIEATYYTPTGAVWNSVYNSSNSVLNGYITQKAVQSMDKTDLEDDPEIVSRPYVLWEDVSDAIYGLNNYDALWYNGYLRVDPFENPKAYGYKRKHLVTYLLTRIDSDVRKKKVATWKKVVAIIIFVLAVVFALPTGGASLTWGQIATAILVASLVLTLATLAFAAAGQADWASAFASAQKTVEPLVDIASVIVVIGGIKEKITTEVAKRAATGAAQRSAADIIRDFVMDFVEDLVENLIQGYTDVMAGQITTMSISFTNKMLDIINILGSLSLERIHDRNKDLQSEYNKLVEETNQENDTLQGFMHIYAKPATADWSMYASLYDLPYERAGGRLALGNIQRTTKQALRKANYDDPAFENIVGL